jgi:hypothetical protein
LVGIHLRQFELHAEQVCEARLRKYPSGHVYPKNTNPLFLIPLLFNKYTYNLLFHRLAVKDMGLGPPKSYIPKK